MSKFVKARSFFTGATEQANAGDFVTGRQLANLHVDPIRADTEVRSAPREFSGSVFDRTIVSAADAPAAETAVIVSHEHDHAERGFALQTRSINIDPRVALLDAGRFCGTHEPGEKNFNGYERHAEDADRTGANMDRLPGEGHETWDEGTLNVTVGGTVSGVIDTTGDVDTITVSLVAGNTYSFYLYGSGGTPVTDTFLSLFGTDGTTLINEDDDGGVGIYSLITYTAATTGTYTLTAESFSNPGDPGLGGWTLAVHQQGADEAPSAPPSGIPVTVGLNYGFINPAGTDEDVYSITLTAGFIYNFEVAAGADYNSNWQAPPTGEVDTIIPTYNSAGTLIFTGDDIDFPDDIS